MKIFSLALAVALMCGPVVESNQSAVASAVDLKSIKPGCLLGAARDGKWILSNDASLNIGERRYRFYSLAGEVGAATGGKPYNSEVPCEETKEVKFSPEPPSSATIAFGGEWNPLPRTVRVQSTEQAVYREVVAAFLKSKGIANPRVNLAQVIRVDLEGDGTEEVILSATTFKEGNIPPDSKAGDYSIVLLRKVVAGRAETIPVYAEYYVKAKKFNAPNWCTVSAVLDLNGDGRMEIVFHGQYYEGAWTTVYAVDGTKIEEALRCGCGV
ncbi:MAG: VCBS repeat-containing protein [Acidobacteriota bacterium]